MPSETWIADRKMLTVWLMRVEAEAFAAACKAAGKRQSDVLREAVLIMLQNGRKP